jgi:hypothetical protein
VVVALEIQDAQTAKRLSEVMLRRIVWALLMRYTCGKYCEHSGYESSEVAETNFLKGPNFAAIEQRGQGQGRVNLPLDFFREALITKEFFKKKLRNAAVADLMRFQTPASEVREQWMIEPEYLKLSLNTTNPVPSTRKRDVSAAAYAWRGGGKYIASVLDAVAPQPM